MTIASNVFQGNTFYFEWEVALQQWLQGMMTSDIAVSIVSFITMFGEELVMIAVLGCVIFLAVCPPVSVVLMSLVLRA